MSPTSETLAERIQRYKRLATEKDELVVQLRRDLRLAEAEAESHHAEVRELIWERDR